MSAPQPPPVEARLTFEGSFRFGHLPVSRYTYDGKDLLVILAGDFPAAHRVRAGDTWQCRLWKRTTCMLAQPLTRVHPPPEQSAPEPPLAGGEDAEPVMPVAQQEANPAAPWRLVADPKERVEVRLVPAKRVVTPSDELPWVVLDSFSGYRVALFLHGPDLDEMIDDLAVDVDWRTLREEFVASGYFAGAFLHDLDQGDATERILHAQLAREHYTIRLTTPTTGAERAAEEALERLHVDFALDVATSSVLYDVAFLFASSARFVPLVQWLQSRGKRLFVVSSRNCLSHELALAAHKPIYYIEDVDKLARGPPYER